MNAYNNFARIYDTLMDDVDYCNWFAYIQDLLRKHEHKPKKVLEMACGTGNITKYLCEEDYEVTCFDISEEMLAVAYDKLRRYKNCKILNQDMIGFDLNRKYDLIISLCDSINYITDFNDLIKVFTNTHSHLEDGGLFIFDINSYYKLSNIIGNNTFVEDRDDIFYVWDNRYHDLEALCYFYLTFFVKQPNEDYFRFDEEHIEKAYKENEIIDALRCTGFEVEGVYESFTLNSPKEKSERINFVARKKGNK